MSHKQPSRWILVSTHYMRTSWSPNINRTMLKHTEAKTLQYIEHIQCFAQMNDIVKFLLENQAIYSLDLWNIITKLLSCLWLRINWGFLLDGQKAQWLYGPLMSDICSCVRMYCMWPIYSGFLMLFLAVPTRHFSFPDIVQDYRYIFFILLFSLKKTPQTYNQCVALVRSEVSHQPGQTASLSSANVTP